MPMPTSIRDHTRTQKQKGQCNARSPNEPACAFLIYGLPRSSVHEGTRLHACESMHGFTTCITHHQLWSHHRRKRICGRTFARSWSDRRCA
eukprot:6172581-Pleurochrysis_carterae.AAC.5